MPTAKHKTIIIEVDGIRVTFYKPEMTMAAYLDNLIESGDEIDQIVAKAKAEAERRNLRTKFTKGIILSHIKFRAKQALGAMDKRPLQ